MSAPMVPSATEPTGIYNVFHAYPAVEILPEENRDPQEHFDLHLDTLKIITELRRYPADKVVEFCRSMYYLVTTFGVGPQRMSQRAVYIRQLALLLEKWKHHSGVVQITCHLIREEIAGNLNAKDIALQNGILRTILEIEERLWNGVDTTPNFDIRPRFTSSSSSSSSGSHSIMIPEHQRKGKGSVKAAKIIDFFLGYPLIVILNSFTNSPITSGWVNTKSMLEIGMKWVNVTLTKEAIDVMGEVEHELFLGHLLQFFWSCAERHDHTLPYYRSEIYHCWRAALKFYSINISTFTENPPPPRPTDPILRPFTILQQSPGFLRIFKCAFPDCKVVAKDKLETLNVMCPQCMRRWYCSKECASKHWNGHSTDIETMGNKHQNECISADDMEKSELDSIQTALALHGELVQGFPKRAKPKK